MLANGIVKLLAKGPTTCHAVAKLPQTFQQVRHARKKFQLQFRYGLKPLYSDDLYQEAKNTGQIEELAFEKIRFPRIWENNSPFFDETRDRFLRYMMVDGRRWLMDDLLRETFYEIKIIQLKRLRRQRQKQKEAAERGEDKKASQTNLLNDEDEEEIITDPMVLFHRAIDNCKPVVITKKIRRGGAQYQVPYPISANDSEWLAMRWLNEAVKERPKPREKHFPEVMAQEVLDAASGRGKVVKKRDDIHRLAQANKAYAHYRWG